MALFMCLLRICLRLLQLRDITITIAVIVTFLSSPITTVTVSVFAIAVDIAIAIVFMSIALVCVGPALSLSQLLALCVCVYLWAALRIVRQLIHHIFRSAESRAIVERRPWIFLPTITHHAIPVHCYVHNNCSRCLFVTRTVTAASP